MTTKTKQIIRIGQIIIEFLLEGKDTKGQFAMFEITIPGNAKVPIPRSHEQYDQTIYGLKGVMTFVVDGVPIDIAAGETCFIPRGSIHGFKNHRKEDAKALAIVTPALIGPDFFRNSTEVFCAHSPCDAEKLKKALKKYGLVPALPN